VARRKTVEDSTVTAPGILDDMMDALLEASYRVPVRCEGGIPSSLSMKKLDLLCE
jgi:hypothetical protein